MTSHTQGKGDIPKAAGYHSTAIPKGSLGELSKLQEELAEAIDADTQGAKILVLCELADLYGAVQCYLQKHFPCLSMGDLAQMAALTAKAFKEGHR